MRSGTLLIIGLGLSAVAFAREDPDTRAFATVAKMTRAEQITLINGLQAIPSAEVLIPPGARVGAGFVPGVTRLNIPALFETDAGLGVGYLDGVDNPGATALPSGIAMGATWNPQRVREGGSMIGAEARARGFNVMLGGAVNLMRDPRNGRTFEYLGEDPLQSGVLAGAQIAGIQSNHVVSTVKHFALNDQETGRSLIDVRIAEAAARESDLLAFEIAIETGQPGSVMCSYNQVNGRYACGNEFLLNQVLKRDWHYPGWVMSDWGAVHQLDYVLAGLDTISGQGIEEAEQRAQRLAAAAAADGRYAARLADASRRIVRTLDRFGLEPHPPIPIAIDFAKDGAIAQRIAAEGMVLLRNHGDLPLSPALRRIAVIGGYASQGVLGGGGSAQVQGEGGAAVTVPTGDDSPPGAFAYQAFQRSSPLRALQARLPNVQFTYRNGRYLTDAVIAAKQADLVLVFATQWMSEAYDVPDLSLPQGQDDLIEAVASANPHTVVVLETGGPVLMPWLNKTAAVLEAWYPGARGAAALASVLAGDVTPSGRLPVSFPASLAQLPRPALPGSETLDPNFGVLPTREQTLSVNYDVEGSDVGYRWYARTGQAPLFPFGFGLSYTRFVSSALALSGQRDVRATFSVRNVGERRGAEVAQLYLVRRAGVPLRRLVGFQKVDLAPGERQTLTLTLDLRLLADWRAGGWLIPGGAYSFALGKSSEELGAESSVEMAARRLAP